MSDDLLLITPDIFERLSDGNFFAKFVSAQYGDVAIKARMTPKISMRSLFDSHYFWILDLRRVNEFETPDSEPDHFKHAGHLAYWLRRSAPVFEWIDNRRNFQDAPGFDLLPYEDDLRDLLLKYGNEYLAFDLGFRLSKYFECGRLGINPKENQGVFPITEDYIVTISHFLKAKNVSPHALFLIYKALFLRP